MSSSVTKIILGVMVLSVVATVLNVNAIAWWEENTWNGKRDLAEIRSQTMVSLKLQNLLTILLVLLRVIFVPNKFQEI